MIFDNVIATELIVMWQTHNDEETFNEILLLSTPLIEVIASVYYESEHREDLIQEAKIKLHKALKTYDTTVGSAYSYITAVVRNCCNDFMRDEHRHSKMYSDMPVVQEVMDSTDDYIYIERVLAEMVTRNRCRFPSIPVDTIDDATYTIYASIIDGSNKPRGIVLHLMEELDLSRPIATVLYHSSLAWLRKKYLKQSICTIEKVDEFTLLPDVIEVLGEPVYKILSTVFGGMYLKIP